MKKRSDGGEGLAVHRMEIEKGAVIERGKKKELY
jgi:hypothetical protein